MFALAITTGLTQSFFIIIFAFPAWWEAWRCLRVLFNRKPILVKEGKIGFTQTFKSREWSELAEIDKIYFYITGERTSRAVFVVDFKDRRRRTHQFRSGRPHKLFRSEDLDVLFTTAELPITEGLPPTASIKNEAAQRAIYRRNTKITGAVTLVCALLAVGSYFAAGVFLPAQPDYSHISQAKEKQLVQTYYGDANDDGVNTNGSSLQNQFYDGIFPGNRHQNVFGTLDGNGYSKAELELLPLQTKIIAIQGSGKSAEWTKTSWAGQLSFVDWENKLSANQGLLQIAPILFGAVSFLFAIAFYFGWKQNFRKNKHIKGDKK